MRGERRMFPIERVLGWERAQIEGLEKKGAPKD